MMYLKLREIMDVLFAPHVQRMELVLLKILISEYLEMRSDLFPQESMKNKHHHLIHYPRLIEAVGPMSKFWCMRFEQKHQRSKRLAYISGNFKNLPKSLAAWHQTDVASRLLLNNESGSHDVETGPGDVVSFSQLSNGYVINNLLGGECMYLDFYKCENVRVHGTQYKCGCCLLYNINFEMGMPEFAILSDILVRDHDEVMFACEKLTTVAFSNHFHSWSVEFFRSQQQILVNPRDLPYFIPHVINYVKVSSDCDSVNQNLGLIALRYRI
jgi:hypothetical protein